MLLTWGTARWLAPRPPDPLERLIDASRPAWLRLLRGVGRSLLVAYGITFALGLAVLPLVAARYHLVSLVGLLIGPPPSGPATGAQLLRRLPAARGPGGDRPGRTGGRRRRPDAL